MTAEKVIEYGLAINQGLTWLNVLLIVAGAALIVFGVVLLMDDDGRAVLVGGLLVIAGVSLAIPNLSYDEKAERNIEDWKSSIAYPYIEQLNTKSVELEYVKLDSGVSNESMGEGLDLVLIYKEEGKLISKKGNFEVELISGERVNPYMEYKFLEDDLGHGLEPGNYFVTVYLPDDFNFTE